MRNAGIGLLVGLVTVWMPWRVQADEHWTTTNGIHKGVIQWSGQGQPGDSLTAGGLGYIGMFRLSYAMWELGGQPLHEFAFMWDWRDRDNLVVGKGEPAVKAGDLLAYPDLRKRFLEHSPLSVELSTTIELFDGADRRIATGQKPFLPTC